MSRSFVELCVNIIAQFWSQHRSRPSLPLLSAAHLQKKRRSNISVMHQTPHEIHDKDCEWPDGRCSPSGATQQTHLYASLKKVQEREEQSKGSRVWVALGWGMGQSLFSKLL